MDVFEKEYFDEMKDDIETILENQKKMMDKLEISEDIQEIDDEEYEEEALVNSEDED